MTCRTCWYWSEGPKGNDNPEMHVGECRRKSPSVGGFPKTYLNQWCGDFTSSGFMPHWGDALCSNQHITEEADRG